MEQLSNLAAVKSVVWGNESIRFEAYAKRISGIRAGIFRICRNGLNLGIKAQARKRFQ